MTDKRYYTSIELIKIATEHAYSAEYLLQECDKTPFEPLTSVISLLYMAFELTFKAYLLHVHKKNSQHKNLIELLEAALDLGLSNEEMSQLKKLSRHYAFRKGVEYFLWEDRQECQIFCSELMSLYERLQEMMPVELQKDYQ